MFADVPRPSERTGLPSWAVPLYCSVLCASTTLPQTRVTHAVILPVLLLFAYHGLSYTTGKAGDDYALGTHLIMQIYAYGELTLLSPLASTRRKDRGGLWTAPVPPGTSFGQASWLQRARMSLALWPSMRRIGWNVELDKSRPIKQVGGEQALSRWRVSDFFSRS